MGIFIHMNISTSVTREEWHDVYQEAYKLVNAFPLAERLEVPVRGIPTMCLVRTQEREHSRGWFRETVEMGWYADGDYETLRTAETYFLPRDLVAEDGYDPNAPDAMFAMAPLCLGGYSWDDERCGRCYSLWDAKTQGEPYHMYLLAIACLIASRLGRKAYVYGDITKGQCERAVRMANEHLDRKIDTPDQCDIDRLLSRIEDLPLLESEKLELFEYLYLGRKDADFGKRMRSRFSEQVCDAYWKDRFHECRVTTIGFDWILKEYLLWGFDLERLCSFICFEDDGGTTHYESFVKTLMDTKLHHRNKDCADVLEIDPDSESPYGIERLFAQFSFAGARNNKVDRYIPIEEIRDTLDRAIGDFCPVHEIIDDYLQKEEEQTSWGLSSGASKEDLAKRIDADPSSVLAKVFKKHEDVYRSRAEEYDIVEPDSLPYYKTGAVIYPALLDAVCKSFAFYHDTLTEDGYTELMMKAPRERCRWLVQQNQRLLLRDKDWERIFDDITEHPDSFGRYYPMVRVNPDGEGLRSMVRAFVLNDALYSYVSDLVACDEPDS